MTRIFCILNKNENCVWHIKRAQKSKANLHSSGLLPPLYPLEKWFFLLDFRLSDTANSSSDVCDFDNKFEQSSAGTGRKVRQLIGNGRRMRMRMRIRMRILVQSILRSWNCFRFVNRFHCIVAINMATISGSFRTKHTIKWGNKKMLGKNYNYFQLNWHSFSPLLSLPLSLMLCHLILLTYHYCCKAKIF